MNKTIQKEAKGFTIIEVVLVLAIAGLIFLVVFLALPALQRSQRDTQRKSDLGRMMSQVTAYTSNNQGALPTNWSTFESNYMTNGNQSFSDPQTSSSYTITQQATLPSTPPAPAAGNIYVYLTATCGGANGVQASTGGARQFAAVIFQEQGSYYCQNN